MRIVMLFYLFVNHSCDILCFTKSTKILYYCNISAGKTSHRTWLSFKTASRSSLSVWGHWITISCSMVDGWVGPMKH